MAFKITGNFGGDQPGSGEGGGGNGGGINTGTNRIDPPAPRNVSVKVGGLGAVIGSFTVTWQDYSQADWNGTTPFWWSVRYCSAAEAGHAGDRPDTPAPNFYSWVTHVLDKSRSLGLFQAEGHGKYMTLSHTEQLPDGYIMVVGTSGAHVGPPNYPIFVRLTVNLDTIPDVGIVGPNVFTVSKERVPRDVLRFDMTYFILLPPEFHEFAGVHPHVIDYNGYTAPREMGAMARWDGSTGLQRMTYRLPVETGQAEGTATFTHGSAAVLWISNDTFSAGYVGRKIVVDLDSDTADVYQIQTFVDPTHITLNAVFFDPNGVGGTYPFKVLSNSTFYFVPIGKSGARVGDYTTAASVSI